MSVYHRYASREHDEAFFMGNGGHIDTDGKLGQTMEAVQISPLIGTFDSKGRYIQKQDYKMEELLSVFPDAVFFCGYDETLFEKVLIIVYENLQTGGISTISLTKFGLTSYKNIILDSRSRFWPSCENLLPEYKNSNVRRSLAVTNLKNYNTSVNHPGKLSITKYWDETNAGDLANNMRLLTEKKPDELGKKLLEMGLLQSHSIQSLLLDIVHENSSSQVSEKTIKDNNKLVFLLGEQLDHLFDPLLEYSPEAMEISYTAPNSSTYEPPQIRNNQLIDTILNELLNVQTNYTMGLVNLLQNFIIPLRIQVLSTGIGSDMTRINQVFPPTIDEITRINCILHDSLNKVSRYGYVEIIRVVGMILPYFYKAFIRHEANLKLYTTRLNKFYSKNSKTIFSNNSINKGNYSTREIDSIVSGSLLELPKFKLILKRLHDAIESEKLKKKNFENFVDNETSIITYYYNTAIEVIDAFGGCQGSEDRKIDSQLRVFTPTGKILTELATKWPPELQYGWLSRKVVGIYELRNVKPKSFFDLEILIIFSDHLLFLTIIEESYYIRKKNEPIKSLSVSDILMHSLVNEKPLPVLSSLPSMEVNSWCNLNEVITSCYLGVSSHTSSKQDFLRFLNVSKSGFKSDNSDHLIFTKNYEILRSKENKYLSGHKIIELINKAKVLYKNQPFHLFRSTDSKLRIYSTAHEISAYENENCKSPFALFMNIEFEDPGEYFKTHPNLYLVLNTSFINDSQIQLIGYNRTKNFELKEIIAADYLQRRLTEIISQNLELLFMSNDSVVQSLSQGYKYDLDYYVNTFTNYDEIELKQHMKGDIINEEGDGLQSNSKKRTASEVMSIPEVYTNKIIEPPGKVNHLQDKEKIPWSNESSEYNQNSTPKDGIKRRKSIIMKLLKKFKIPVSNGQHASDTGSAKSPPKILHKESNKISLDKKVINAYVPKGEQKEFIKLYTPAPQLKTSLSRSQPNQKTQNLCGSEAELLHKSIDEVNGNTTIQSSHCTSGSIEVNTRFEFPINKRRSLTKDLNNPAIIINKDVNKNDENFEEVIFRKMDNSKSKTEDNILVLDNIVKLTCENPIQSLVFQYNDIKNVGDFYKDGEANWVAFSRENSSLMNQSLVKQDQTLNQEIEADADDSDFSEGNPANEQIPIDREIANNDNDQRLENFFTPLNDSPDQFPNRNYPFTAEVKEVSMQSLSSSQIIDEFGKQIDFKFSGIEGFEEISDISITDEGTMELIEDKQLQLTILNVSSSEEEFYSPNEYVTTEVITHRHNKSDSPITYISNSSDATIINDFLTEDKALPEIPVTAKIKKLPPIPKTNDPPTSLALSSGYDSITYLSDLVSGNLNFNFDDEDKKN